ncbi:uncharacterized protein EI90DRAFT_3076132 [Cantharellus anzutake]|uniref:uncharacterized protein n=1 Tax=Cantharellus anzutake TaxID=1750568 RepID=UPI00190439D0|nr:uncharacterized protein EI90DRAFT_3076132 [Cantharellus anzutake]KAF8324168.1 hypothetical protein EI90DRAFT_3076132 [Cantharellus anzutake]
MDSGQNTSGQNQKSVRADLGRSCCAYRRLTLGDDAMTDQTTYHQNQSALELTAARNFSKGELTEPSTSCSHVKKIGLRGSTVDSVGWFNPLLCGFTVR